MKKSLKTPLKKKSIFRKVWETYAYAQAFLDDTIHLTFKKIKEAWEKVSENPEEEKKIHKKIIKAVWWAVWDAGSWFYEKYSELKTWDNLAEDFAKNTYPEIKHKTLEMSEKMRVLWIEYWNLESLKRFKEPRSSEFYKKIKENLKNKNR